jgi:hypothetical protein
MAEIGADDLCPWNKLTFTNPCGKMKAGMFPIRWMNNAEDLRKKWS